MELTMKSWATLVAGFAILVFNSRISACHPYQTTHSHNDDKKRFATRDREPDSEANISWTHQNQRVQVTTLDVNRGLEPIIPKDYPLPRPHRSQAKQSAVTKKNCIQNFCEDVDYYPETVIKSVLTKAKNLDAYFKEAGVLFDISNRGGFDEEEDTGDTICQTRSITMYPKTANNTKLEEKFLINVEGHRQGIVVQTCLHENAKCRFSDGFPIGYESTCKQKFVRRSLAILAEDNQTTAWDTFEVPSCCVCVIKRVD